MIRQLTLALLLAGINVYAFAQDEPPAAEPPAKPAAADEDPFAVPEGNDSKVLGMFLQKLSRTPPAERTPDGIKAHLQSLDKAVATIMSREIDDELFTSAAEVRMQILSILTQFGDASAVAKRTKLIDELKRDERPAIKEMVAAFELQDRLSKLPTMEEAEKQALIMEVGKSVQDAQADDMQAMQQSIQMAMQVAQTLERSGDTKLAIAAYNLYGKYISAKSFPQAQNLAERMQSTVRRLELPGNTMQVAGTTFEGEQFDIKQLKGKVVLVDFWATWCGPCRAELPNVKRLYSAYHDKGFEVVGISLDDDAEALEEFLDEEDIEWVTLFETDEEKRGWENPISQYYGISGIPTAILLNQEGKVVSLNARGKELADELERLLGPVEQGQEKEAASE